MAEIRRTTIPQFTIRGLLLATTVMAVVSFAFSQALRGTAWVGGVSIGLAALVLSFAVYVLTFAFIAFIARIFWPQSARQPSPQGIVSDSDEPVYLGRAQRIRTMCTACVRVVRRCARFATAGARRGR